MIPQEIERKSTDLSSALNGDNDYLEYAAEHAEERKQAAARELADIVRHAQGQGEFLRRT